MSFNVKMAGEMFTIHSINPDAEEYCKDYLCSETGVNIEIAQDDIEKERAYSICEAEMEGHPPCMFSDAELEITAIYRKIADYFSYQGAAVMHGALIELDGEGYLFTALSGTGKTTHIMNWLKRFPGARVVNGDKPILMAEGEKIIGFGTPWSGKEGMNSNTSVPVKAIISLKRAEKNSISKKKLREILPKIITAVYRPKDAGGVKRAMQFVADMNGKIAFYELACNMDEESAQVAYDGMRE